MKPFIYLIFFMVILNPINLMARDTNLCQKLTAFVNSVKPGDLRTIEFQTSWGGDFKDEPKDSNIMYAKRCIHNNYEPAKLVCDYLMEYGSTEFQSLNFKTVLVCLSPRTKLDRKVSFNQANVSFSYGTADRGALINLSMDRNEDIGGMVLKIEADGY